MATYRGTVYNAQGDALGPIMFSLRGYPRKDQGEVAGNLKVGASPNTFNTGFSGRWGGVAGSFSAKGAQTLQRGNKVYPLAVSIQGASEGGTLRGTIRANIGGSVEDWDFNAEATSTGEYSDDAPLDAGGGGGNGGGGGGLPEKTGGVIGFVRKAWDKTPTSLKVAGAGVLAYLGYKKATD